MTSERSDVFDVFVAGIRDVLVQRELALSKLRDALAEVDVVSDPGAEHRRAQHLVDEASRNWLPEVLRACNEDETLASAREHAATVVDSATASAAASGAQAIHPLLESEPAKAAASHAWQAAHAMTHDSGSCTNDADQTAAINAGKVLGELWLFGDDQDAVAEVVRMAEEL